MASSKNSHSVPVYSTDQGALCPDCGRAVGQCVCRKNKAGPKGDGIVRIGRETKGRKGKGVSVVTGLPLAREALETLAGELRKRCGAGGTVRDGVVEIQGDHRELLAKELEKRGYRVRLAGG